MSEDKVIDDEKIKSKKTDVIIGCKLPHGISLRYGDYQDQFIKLNGLNSTEIVGGFGLTTVDQYIWDNLKTKYSDQPFMTNGCIFEVSKPSDAKKAAKEREKENTGFEQIDPEKCVTKPLKEEKE